MYLVDEKDALQIEAISQRINDLGFDIEKFFQKILKKVLTFTLIMI